MKNFISILFTTIIILDITSCISSFKGNKTQINISCRECSGMEVSLKRSAILPNGLNEIYQSRFDSSGRTEIEFSQHDTLSLLLVVGNMDEDEWKFNTILYFEPGANVELTIENGFPEFGGDLKLINSYYHEIYLIERERLKYVNANQSKYISAS